MTLRDAMASRDAALRDALSRDTVRHAGTIQCVYITTGKTSLESVCLEPSLEQQQVSPLQDL